MQVNVDGKPTATAVTAKGNKTTPFFSIGRVERIVGGLADESDPEFYFQGLLEDVRFYNRVLSAAEIEALAK
ncbi:hypothetical protein AYO44_09800 [Planctomycetaceae bacterium SCGC AG-212-F19]|nr:hypothetical protein AYO44_09800 [Planctomycetaceae bacterium SCGC AG-212-F19]